MNEVRIQLEYEDNEDIDLGQYFHSVIPRIGETLWIDKPDEIQAVEKDKPNFCRIWEVVVVDIIHIIKRLSPSGVYRYQPTELGNVYIIVRDKNGLQD